MGYKISINGEDVWESDGDGLLVDRVVVTNARGEVTTIGSPATDDWLKIEVNVRNAPSDQATYLDMVEADQLNERRSRIEEASVDAVAEGRRQMEEEQAEEEEESPVFGPPEPQKQTVPDLEM